MEGSGGGDKWGPFSSLLYGELGGVGSSVPKIDDASQETKVQNNGMNPKGNEVSLESKEILTKMPV